MGREGRLPWRIPEDSKFFNDQTAGQICVVRVGRICFETWPPGHSRWPPLRGHHSEKILGSERRSRRFLPWRGPCLCRDRSLVEIYVTGGEQVFEEALTLSRPMRLHLTLVHADVAGDRLFPEWRHLPWKEIDRRESQDANFRFTCFRPWSANAARAKRAPSPRKRTAKRPGF